MESAMHVRITLLAGLLLVMTGCAPRQERVPGLVRGSVWLAGGQSCTNSNLLFDAYPGEYRASDFAWRSDWPSTVSYYSPGEVTYFREHFVDWQGGGFGTRDHTRRRAETRRERVSYQP
jgi:hypothetical protein